MKKAIVEVDGKTILDFPENITLTIFNESEWKNYDYKIRIDRNGFAQLECVGAHIETTI